MLGVEGLAEMQVASPEFGVSPSEELLSCRMFSSVISDMMCDHALGELVEMETSFVVFKFLLNIAQLLH